MKYLYDLLVKALQVVRKYLVSDEETTDLYWRMRSAWDKCFKIILSCNNLEELRTAGTYLKGFNSVYGEEFAFEYTLLLTEYNCKLKDLKLDHRIEEVEYISSVDSLDSQKKLPV